MFDMNYMSRWVGSTDGALVSINKVMNLRTISRAEFNNDNKHEYIISMDVARSEKKENNQSSICILKMNKDKKGKVTTVELVNIINMPAVVNFDTQALEVMRLKAIYNAKAVVVDSNGLGAGITDRLLLETIDPLTNQSLGCLATMNTTQEAELEDAEEILYALKSQSINTQIIVNFIDYIDSGKLRLLEKRMNTNYDVNDDDYIRREVLPFTQTDLLLDEIANLQLENLGNSGLRVKQVTRKTDKDRYSALAYGLWYIKNFEDEANGYESNTQYSAADFCLIN